MVCIVIDLVITFAGQYSEYNWYRRKAWFIYYCCLLFICYFL